MEDMREERAPISSKTVLGTTILFSLNGLALIFSGSMLWWTISQLSYQGERWGLIGVMLFGGTGLVVEALLLSLTIWLLREKLDKRYPVRWVGLILIVGAIVLDAAALLCTGQGF